MAQQASTPAGEDRMDHRQAHPGIERSEAHTGIERRRVLQSAAFVSVAGLGAAGIAGCGGGSGGGAGGGGGLPDNLAGKAITQASEIPVGGGRIFKDKEVVVTQPSKGTFHAFSAICTHRGCTVDTVEDGLIKCPCHGSEYDIKDASVEAGPAPKPLPKYRTRVNGGKIILEASGG